jgi:hypothetical protein
LFWKYFVAVQHGSGISLRQGKGEKSKFVLLHFCCCTIVVSPLSVVLRNRDLAFLFLCALFFFQLLIVEVVELLLMLDKTVPGYHRKTTELLWIVF